MSLPKRATLMEVGPRDGFQSISGWIETADKVAVIKALLATGVDSMEAMSFISPKAIPQMRDAAEIAAALKESGVDMGRIYALVGNARGAAQAEDAGVPNITLVISASAAHNLNNVRKTPAQSLEVLAEVRQNHANLHVKLSLATAFGCPFGGAVSDEELLFVVEGAIDQGVADIALCDTTGVAQPLQVRRIFKMLMERYPDINWSAHFHNTRGLAAANTFAALEEGVARFETACAGLGGCPFAPGASGNMATEDLVYLLNELGVETGADLTALIDAADLIEKTLNVQRDSKLTAATAVKVPGRACGEEA